MSTNLYKKVYVFIFSFLLYTTNNLVHAVTPNLIKSIHADKWMNGSYFAFMALAGFIFIPMFGKLSDIIGRKKLFIFSIIIYALGQWLFGNATNKWVIHIYRFIGGLGGPTMFMLLSATLADSSTKKEIAKFMVFLTLIRQLSSGLGKYIGGVLGVHGYHLTFNTQVITLLIIATISFITFPKEEKVVNNNNVLNYKEILTSSFKWTQDITFEFLNSFIGLFLIGYLFFTFNQVIFNNNIVFFINDQLHLSTVVIGEFMLALSISAVIALLIISPLLSKWLETYKIIFISSILAIIFLAISLIINEKWLIISSASILLYYIWTVVIDGFINGYVLENTPEEYGSGYILSLIQSFGFIGRFLGALISGFLFQINDYLPFIFALILLIIFFILFILHKKKKVN